MKILTDSINDDRNINGFENRSLQSVGYRPEPIHENEKKYKMSPKIKCLVGRIEDAEKAKAYCQYAKDSMARRPQFLR